MTDQLNGSLSTSPITIHEDYIIRPDYDEYNRSDPDLSLVSNDNSINNSGNSFSTFAPPPGGLFLQHRRSTVSLISNSLVLDELAHPAQTTTAITLQNVNCDDQGSPSKSFHENAASILESQTTPVLKLYKHNATSNDNISSLPMSPQNELNQEMDEESVGKLLSPLINDQNSINNLSNSMSAASIFSDQASMIQSSSLNDEFSKPIDFGFNLEKADNDSNNEQFFKQRKHFFILSSAGKPIYSMHGSDDILTVYSGIIQTIVSFFQYNPDDETESLKSFVAGNKEEKVRFLFLNKDPIILMASSTLGESDIQLNQQLDFLYNFLLTTLSKPHIDRVFRKRENFDLRKLLGKADIACLDSICNDLANFNNPGLIIGGLECVKIRKTIRNKIEQMLLQNKSENLLYGLLVAPNGRLITVLRPRRHTLHTSDLQLLFSMIFNTNTFKSTVKEDENAGNGVQQLTANEEFWVPVCLPKFNPNGFLYSFIQFIDLKDEKLMKLHDLNMDILKNKIPPDSTKITMILISAFKDSFFEMRKISNNIIKNIKLDRSIYRELFRSIVGTQGVNGQTGLSSGKVSPIDIPAPLVKHFIFKSKKHTQFVYSKLQGQEGEEESEVAKGQLMMMYSYLHSKMLFNNRDNISLSNGTSRNSSTSTAAGEFDKSRRGAGNNESALMESSNFIHQIRWKYQNDFLIGLLISTPNYEIYLINNGGVVDKGLLVKSCKSIIKWCNKNEERLFICGGAVF